MKYSRELAISYAHRWSYERNPAYFDFEHYGGDCTNFVSQCLHAGGISMSYAEDGWYYVSSYKRAPAWTSVQTFYEYFTRSHSQGIKARVVNLTEILPGDVIQLSFSPALFSHTVLVVGAQGEKKPGDIMIAAHNIDSDYRPLSTYEYIKLRAIHLEA
ncbi:hypothetical protein FACS189418_6100 [Clostridia bacterium]|nr:hypothetical protein FACS189418_6100 [Clostridia bacterium]